MRTYLILGGAGCFANNLAAYLLAQKHRVIAVGRNPLPGAEFMLNTGAGNPNYEYHVAHLWRDRDKLLQLLDAKQPNVIVNYAAQGEGALSWNDTWMFFQTNCTGLSWLVEQLMERSYYERFIHIGSSEVYGSVTAPANEDHPICATSPYAISKAAFDALLISLARTRGLRMNILRPSNAYCPGQRLHRIIPKAVLFGMTGQKVQLHGGGQSRKSYIHATDLSRAVHYTAEFPAPLGAVYNVGPELPVSIRSLVMQISDKLGVAWDDLVTETPDRLGQDSKYWLDSSRIKKDLGWYPFIPLDKGIETMIEWVRQHVDTLSRHPTIYTVTE